MNSVALSALSTLHASLMMMRGAAPTSSMLVGVISVVHMNSKAFADLPTGRAVCRSSDRL